MSLQDIDRLFEQIRAGTSYQPSRLILSPSAASAYLEWQRLEDEWLASLPTLEELKTWPTIPLQRPRWLVKARTWLRHHRRNPLGWWRQCDACGRGYAITEYEHRRSYAGTPHRWDTRPYCPGHRRP